MRSFDVSAPAFPQLSEVMVRPSVSAAVFPQIGDTLPQASRIDPDGLSPFAAFIRPVPPPKVVRGANIFPELQEMQIIQELEEIIAEEPEFDESELERRREEAVARGFKQGHSEGFRKGTVEGYDLGREQGLKEAYETVIGEQREILDQFNAALQQVIDNVNVQIADWFREREEAMADVAMAAVQRLLSSELATTRESAVAIAQDALGELTHAQHARIRVNPFDSAILEQHRSLLISCASTLRDIEIVRDENITGGCIVETDGGVVDSRLEIRMEALEDAWRPAA